MADMLSKEIVIELISSREEFKNRYNEVVNKFMQTHPREKRSSCETERFRTNR